MKEYDIRIRLKELTGSDGSFSLKDPVFYCAVKKALRKSGANPESSGDIVILKRSFDFRPGREPAVELKLSIGLGRRSASSGRIVPVNTNRMQPVIAGFGPAGIFCGLTLARAGLRPVILERGNDIDGRTEKVKRYWETGIIDENTNVQFGEGGAGAYSDGKLTTLVREKNRLGREVLETFVEFGAPEDILIDSHPHIGTDLLRNVVKNIRNEIIRLGGTVLFGAKLTGIGASGGSICRAVYETETGTSEIRTDAVFLAIGHGARDTFRMLLSSGISLSPKPMAVGFRIEHPQSLIDHIQYGEYAPLMSKKYPAIYKLSSRLAKSADISVPVAAGNPQAGQGNIRSAFTFCMCPGGYVVNASSEAGGLVTNGMSYSARDGVNANSAILVGVTPEDYLPYGSNSGSGNGNGNGPGGEFNDCNGDPLAGIVFQQAIEKKAFELTGSTGRLPMQKLKDFSRSVTEKYGRELSEFRKNGAISVGLPSRREGSAQFYENFTNQTCGAAEEADISGLFPSFINLSVLNGILEFDRRMAGFGDPEAILTAPETRSSCPVRILRDPVNLESISVQGLYPAGEGAGYAGGITSSAIDGIRAAESYISKLT